MQGRTTLDPAHRLRAVIDCDPHSWARRRQGAEQGGTMTLMARRASLASLMADRRASSTGPVQADPDRGARAAPNAGPTAGRRVKTRHRGIIMPRA